MGASPDSFDGIINSLTKKEYRPIYFLWGDEPYFIDKIADHIANNVLNDSEKEFNQTIVYGKETTADNIINMASRYPMMSEYQVIIIREAQNLKKLDELLNYIKSPVKSTILTFCYKYKKLDKRTKFYKVLKDQAVIYESKKIYPNKIPIWIKNRTREAGCKISENAVLLLAEYLGDDLHKIENALDKLTINLNGEKEINTRLIEENIGISREYNVFELQKAIGFKEHERVNRIISHMKENPKQNPMPQIIGALFSYFSKVIILQYSKERPEEIAGKINVPPFFVKEYIKAGHNYKGKLQKIISLLHEYDLRSKGVNDSGTEEGELLREMTLRIMSL